MTHDQIDPAALTPRKMYRLLIGLVTPRPIAWVGTISPQGIPNLAPFSFFNGVAANPPTLVFSVSTRRDGSHKDTLRNIMAIPEFTVSTVSYSHAEQMNATAAELPYNESEFSHAHIDPVPSVRVRPPRVAGAKVQMECVLHQLVPVGEGPLSATLVIGRIVLMHLENGVLDPQGDPDPQVLDHIGRMGGDGYCRIGDRFSIKRP
ncbi:MAG: flavin reductase family protein [Polyangia bacterium]